MSLSSEKEKHLRNNGYTQSSVDSDSWKKNNHTVSNHNNHINVNTDKPKVYGGNLSDSDFKKYVR